MHIKELIEMNAEGVTITVDVIMHPHSTINPESFMRVNFCNKNFRTTTLPMKIFLHLIFSSIYHESRVGIFRIAKRTRCYISSERRALTATILSQYRHIQHLPITSLSAVPPIFVCAACARFAPPIREV